MTVTTLWIFFKSFGSFLGILITIITFFGLVSKKPLAALRKLIREEGEAANSGIKEQLNDIEKKIQVAQENDVAILRNTITHIYFKYKDQKKIPHYEKENVLSLWERYDALHGNHYIHHIIEEIKTWEEII